MKESAPNWALLTPGQRDGLVARHLFGWSLCNCGEPECAAGLPPGEAGEPRLLPQYQSDISEALAILDRFEDVEIRKETMHGGIASWSVTINQDWSVDYGWQRINYGSAGSLAEAICKAALDASGVDVQ